MGEIFVKILKIYVKMMILIFVFYFGMNLFAFKRHTGRLERLATQIQALVQNNGFIPPIEYESIKTILAEYGYEVEGADEEGTVMYGLNNVVRNIKVVILEENEPLDTEERLSQEEMETRGMTRKQWGTIRKIGISFDYYWINPIDIYNKNKQGVGGEIKLDAKNANAKGNVNVGQIDVGDRTEKLERNILKAGHIRYVESVLTQKYYADLLTIN